MMGRPEGWATASRQPALALRAEPVSRLGASRIDQAQTMIAALFVQEGGCYYGLPNVDPWPESRDARAYDGPWPVVAHPPCQRWGKMWFGQPLAVKLTGKRKTRGDDGGCFEAALNAVRRFGGVLEHPELSYAWKHFELNEPPRHGGWVNADFEGGWTCCVEQGRYGHYARKPTWLYAFGCELPSLDWGKGKPRLDPAVIERMGFKPEPFRDLLISIAKTANRERIAVMTPNPSTAISLEGALK